MKNRKKKKKKINKTSKILIVILLLLSIGFIGTGCYFFYFKYNILFPIVNDANIKDNVLSIYFNKYSLLFSYNTKCLISSSNEIPKINDENWINISNNKCSFDIDDNNYYVFLKNNSDKIKLLEDKTNKYKLNTFTINKDDIYIPNNSKYNIDYSLKTYLSDDNIKFISSNENIITIEDGIVSSKGYGKATIDVSFNNIKEKINVYVVNGITNIPKSYDETKPYLPCNIFNEEEQTILDEALLYRVNQAGGKKTRAGVVAAARFLTLEFAYRIEYFFENGRLSGTGTNIVDGEGRYYHEGLYLNESKFKDISNTFRGPKTWGCPLTNYEDYGYKYRSGNTVSNGLDCSGFVTWALVNGGYDPGDVGADYTLAWDLIMDNPEIVHKISEESIKNAKAGDLISEWGHIAMIVGKDDEHMYVAESLPQYGGVVIKTYTFTRDSLYHYFDFITDMSSIYKEDGNYTEMWY